MPPDAEERFRATLEQAAIGMAHQTLDDKWVWFNQRWCDIVGFSREELLARNLSGLTHPNDREASAEFDRKVRSGQLERHSIWTYVTLFEPGSISYWPQQISPGQSAGPSHSIVRYWS